MTQDPLYHVRGALPLLGAGLSMVGARLLFRAAWPALIVVGGVALVTTWFVVYQGPLGPPLD